LGVRDSGACVGGFGAGGKCDAGLEDVSGGAVTQGAVGTAGRRRATREQQRAVWAGVWRAHVRAGTGSGCVSGDQEAAREVPESRTKMRVRLFECFFGRAAAINNNGSIKSSSSHHLPQ
jgi:hypothetical protein